MAGDIHLQLDDIKGESADDKHKDEIEVLGWTWGNKSSLTLFIFVIRNSQYEEYGVPVLPTCGLELLKHDRRDDARFQRREREAKRHCFIGQDVYVWRQSSAASSFRASGDAWLRTACVANCSNREIRRSAGFATSSCSR